MQKKNYLKYQSFNFLVQLTMHAKYFLFQKSIQNITIYCAKM